jgi:hypothetical protein
VWTGGGWSRVPTWCCLPRWLTRVRALPLPPHRVEQKNDKSKGNGSINGFPGAKQILTGSQIKQGLELECDILIPAALEKQVRRACVGCLCLGGRWSQSVMVG